MSFKRPTPSTLPEQDPMDWYKEQVRGITERIPGTMLTIRPAAAPEGVKFQIVQEPASIAPDGSIAQAGTYYHYAVSMEDETLPYSIRVWHRCIPAPLYTRWGRWTQLDLDAWVEDTVKTVHISRTADFRRRMRV